MVKIMLKTAFLAVMLSAATEAVPSALNELATPENLIAYVQEMHENPARYLSALGISVQQNDYRHRALADTSVDVSVCIVPLVCDVGVSLMQFMDCLANKKKKGTVFDKKFSGRVRKACECKKSKTKNDLTKCLSKRKVFEDTDDIKFLSDDFTTSKGEIDTKAMMSLFDSGASDDTVALVEAVCDKKCFVHLNRGMQAMLKFQQADADAERKSNSRCMGGIGSGETEDEEENEIENPEFEEESPELETFSAESMEGAAPSSSVAVDASLGQSRAALRSMCAYHDATPKDSKGRVYCAKTMQLIADSYKLHGNTAAVVEELCPSTTDNELKTAGCCVREAMQSAPVMHNSPDLWVALADGCGLNLADPSTAGYVQLCKTGMGDAASFAAKFQVTASLDVCANEAVLRTTLETIATGIQVQKSQVTLVRCKTEDMGAVRKLLTGRSLITETFTSEVLVRVNQIAEEEIARAKTAKSLILASQLNDALVINIDAAITDSNANVVNAVSGETQVTSPTKVESAESSEGTFSGAAFSGPSAAAAVVTAVLAAAFAM